MYLSRVKIDVNNRQKTRDLNHLGAYHSWVEESFPAEINAGRRSRKLWRVDPIGDDFYLLVLSRERPDLEKLEKYGVMGSAETKDYSVLLARLRTGDKLRFRAVLNPIKSLSRGKKSGERGRIIPLVTADQQLQYLKERSEQHGFSLNDDEVMITERGFEILKRKNGKQLKICKAAYGGLLKIEDLDLFKAVLINGLGKKKAYGFGLITVIPGDER
ncbi:MAG TPA: type I-E CRISPR-associated protein Cas6/Cse3/CasE [Firmicutes bacterium]|nr:type I-E CRISPR-associated protein Cas6/Cse3/CasE [Bacillota bacterium]